MTLASPPNTGKLARFFVPMAVQAASQALCYPLVAMVASRGPGGPLNLAGLAQSNTVMFFLGMFAIYFVTTGMVFARDRESFLKFQQVVVATGLAVTAVQAVLGIPAISHLIFGRLIGLPPSIEAPAQTTLLASIPLQILFFLRIPYFVAMYVGRASGRASLATIGRVLLTAVLAPLFSAAGWVGPLWAVACLTFPVAVEAVVARKFAGPYIAALTPSGAPPPPAREMFLFNLPLAAGGYMLAIAGIFLGGFIARAPDPERVMPVYYLALGLANPAAFAATRIQTVVLAFPSDKGIDRGVGRFALLAGVVLGLLPLVFAIPGPSEWYYVTLQALDPADIGLVRQTALSLVLFPAGVALRARNEGLAAWHKKPAAVMWGHAVFLMTLLGAAALCLMLRVPGFLIGSVGLTLGNVSSATTIRLSLKRFGEKAVPPGQTTTTSTGQIR